MEEVLIIGVGVAGSYLGARLAQDGFNVRGLEAQRREGYRSTCAWATSLNGMGKYLRGIDVDIDEYVLYEADGIDVDVGGIVYHVPTSSLATVDKPSLILRMADEFRVDYGSRVKSSDRGALRGGGHLITVDATGVARTAIGPAGHGTDDVLPAYQVLAKYRDPPYEGFYVKPFSRYMGYLWYFPLGGNRFFIGAGDAQHRHLDHLSEFLSSYRPDEVIRREGRPIRISPPETLRPILTLDGQPMVAVGEAAGSVFPILGEGILPSVESAELLARGILAYGEGDGAALAHYVDDLKDRFSVFGAAYRFIKGKQGGRCSYTNPTCISDAAALAKFFLSRRGRTLTGIAPNLRHAFLAVRPF